MKKIITLSCLSLVVAVISFAISNTTQNKQTQLRQPAAWTAASEPVLLAGDGGGGGSGPDGDGGVGGGGDF